METNGIKKKRIRLTPAQIKRKKRRADAFALIQQGATWEQTAKQLKISSTTLEQDIKFIREERMNEYQSNSPVQRMADYNEQQRLRRMQLWKIISDPNATLSNKSSATKELREEEELSIKKDQILGILPRSVDNIVAIQNQNKETKVHIHIHSPEAVDTKSDTEDKDGKREGSERKTAD